MLGDQSTPNSTIELFRKMQTHCNFLSDLDSLGDMNNANKLREVIQNEAYILAITAEKNRNLEQELRNVKSSANQLKVKTHKIEENSQQLVNKLTEAESKLYDIDFDTY